MSLTKKKKQFHFVIHFVTQWLTAASSITVAGYNVQMPFSHNLKDLWSSLSCVGEWDYGKRWGSVFQAILSSFLLLCSHSCVTRTGCDELVLSLLCLDAQLSLFWSLVNKAICICCFCWYILLQKYVNRKLMRCRSLTMSKKLNTTECKTNTSSYTFIFMKHTFQVILLLPQFSLFLLKKTWLQPIPQKDESSRQCLGYT